MQHCCAEMSLHKCLLTVNRKVYDNRLFRVRTVCSESFHSMSYYHNNIHGGDSDAVDVRRELLVLIAVLQLVKKQLRKKTN